MLNEENLHRHWQDKHDSLAVAIHKKLSKFQNYELKERLTGMGNRLEFVAKIGALTFINDSPSTNVNATWYALETVSSKIVLIMGGVERDNDYSQLVQIVQKKVSAIVCLGEHTSKITAAFIDHVETIVYAHCMCEAVRLAYHLANDGETVLLSPACASFDLFKNYEDRGNQFKTAIKELSVK